MTTDVESNGSDNHGLHSASAQEVKERQQEAVTGEIRNLNEIPASLFYWNIAASIFQFAQAAVLFYLSSQADTKWFWYVVYPATFEERDENPEDFGRPGPEEVASFSVTWYSAAFIALSGLDHMICAIFRQTYEYYIARHQNPFRWAEYALSASLMRVMIAQLTGITDIHLLFTIFALCALTMLLGSIHESVNARARADGFQQNWYPFIVSWIAHLASWMPIVNYFFVAVKRGDPPNFVWSIIFILFFLDGTFAALFSLQWLKIWKFKDYVFGEKGFILLSFTAKALLAWINYGGGSR